MDDKKKCIFLVAPQGFATRYLLQTDVFRTLKATDRHLVILTPNPDEEYFKNQYAADNVTIEKLEIEKCQAYLDRTPAQRFVKQLRFYVLNGKHNLQSIDDHYKIFLAENAKHGSNGLTLKIFDLLMRILRASRLARKMLLRLEASLFNPDFHADLFKRYKPTLVVTTSLGNVGESIDAFIMREAQKYRIKTLTIFLSWDNPSSKGMGGAVPDNIIAWTDVMKQEIIDYHDYPAERIFVGGVAHFDVYQRKEKFIPWNEFPSKFGLVDNRKILLFGTKSPVSYPWNPDIAEMIAKAIRDNKLAVPCQLLVRVHPLHYSIRRGKEKNVDMLEQYRTIEREYEHVHLNEPEIKSVSLKHDMAESEMTELASILDHTDVLINMFSTLTIEAALMNVPVVNVSFEGNSEKKKHPRQDIATDIAQVHNQRVIKTGAVKMAYSEHELIDAINSYLKNPSLDEAQRKLVAQQECGPCPGNAGKNIGNHILSLS